MFKRYRRIIEQFRSRDREGKTPISPEQALRAAPLLGSPALGPSLVKINLGIDFGTRFTKVAYRNEALEQSGLVNIGNSKTTWSESLIPSIIKIGNDSRIYAGFSTKEWESLREPNLRTVDYLKMRLADLDVPPSKKNLAV